MVECKLIDQKAHMILINMRMFLQQAWI